jgi:hypothetical protein
MAEETNAATVETADPSATAAPGGKEAEGQRDEFPASVDELAARFSEGMKDGPGDAAAETAEAAPEQKPEAKAPEAEKPETPAFDPKAEGLPEPYWNCKSAGEVARLAEKRRADAEGLAKAHDDELGSLRKKVQEAEKAPEKPPETAPAEWTEQQRAELHRAFDESPETVLAWHAQQVQAPLLEKIAILETRLAAVEGKAENVVKETRAEREARELSDAGREWSAFLAEHPDAAEMRGENGALMAAFRAVNEGRPAGEVNDNYADMYGVAKLAGTDKDLHALVVKHMRRGYRFAEAQDIAEALRAKDKHAKAEQARKVEEAKRKGRVASVGTGGGSPGSGPVEETDLDSYLHNRGLA